MRDSEVVASIVAGEPEGLAAAYDRYASDLFGYCRSLLAEPDDAADAVQDTFVIAASKLSGLRDRDRLRAWLFAVARNECLRRLKSRHAAAPLQNVPEPADENADVTRPAERAETIALVRAAAAGLNDGERDVLNQLWHGLEVPEVANVLGVSRNHAHSLFSRARDQLEASVGVLLVGRTGRRDCVALDQLLGDWDGRLTARLRKRVGRHIDSCGVCSDRRRQQLAPAMLYSLTPGALLAITALRGAPALHGAGQLSGPLAGVRDAVMHLVGGGAAGGHGAGLSTASFGLDGFPKPLHTGPLGFLPRPHLPLAAVSGTAVAATATVVVTAVVPHVRVLHDHHAVPPAASGALAAGAPPAAGGAPGQPGASAAPGALPSGAASASVHGSQAALEKQAARVPGATPGIPGITVATGGGQPAGRATADPADTPANDATDRATADTGSTGAGVSVAASTPPVAISVGADVGVGTSAGQSTAAAGTLSVSPTAVLLSGLLGSATVTLTASDGPVSWSISPAASLLGSVTVSPSSGTLAAGASVTVTVTATTLLSLASTLTVEPGGQVVTVVLGLGLGLG
jgi:RNA polymerase sigma factor (sigma-70 family)